MRFSIIVPIYNKQQHLPKCIESIQNQSFSDFECILVDDGSTDNSSKIAKDISTIDKRFKYLYKPNGGLVSARKAGMRLSKGDYIINVDADDFVRYDLLEYIDNEIKESNPDTVCFNYTLYKNGTLYENDTHQAIGLFTENRLNDVLGNYLYDSTKKHINSGPILFNICAKAIRRDLYINCQEKINNNIVSGEDTVFTLVWCFNTKRISCINYDGYIYRQEESSIEHTFNDKCFSNLELVCNEMLAINDVMGGKYQNSICAYKFYRFERYIYLLAQNSKSYFEFIEKVKRIKINYPTLINISFTNNFRSVSKIRYIVVKYRLWIVCYILAKTKYKEIL